MEVRKASSVFCLRASMVLSLADRIDGRKLRTVVKEGGLAPYVGGYRNATGCRFDGKRKRKACRLVAYTIFCRLVSFRSVQFLESAVTVRYAEKLRGRRGRVGSRWIPACSFDGH